ncbi:unnamed protein product [Urochloa humidicola]
MAGRLLIQKLSSGAYRSTGRLGRAIAPVTRTASADPAQATKYFSIVPCSHAAKTNWPVKRTFSSSSFNKHKASSEAKMSPRRISLAEHAADLNRTSNTVTVLAVFTGLGWIYIENNV